MNILYVHGYKAKFDINSPKNQSLSKIGTVYGIDIDFNDTYDYIIQQLIDALSKYDIDLIVGTSMGGYLANMLGTSTGIPFVMINPAIDPKGALTKYNHSKEVIDSYDPISYNAAGLLLLDLGDDVIDPHETIEYFYRSYETHTFEDGSHRFDHMDESLELITHFYNASSVALGFDEQ